jgi:hypothetical protein
MEQEREEYTRPGQNNNSSYGQGFGAYQQQAPDYSNTAHKAINVAERLGHKINSYNPISGFLNVGTGGYVGRKVGKFLGGLVGRFQGKKEAGEAAGERLGQALLGFKKVISLKLKLRGAE